MSNLISNKMYKDYINQDKKSSSPLWAHWAIQFYDVIPRYFITVMKVLLLISDPSIGFMEEKERWRQDNA